MLQKENVVLPVICDSNQKSPSDTQSLFSPSVLFHAGRACVCVSTQDSVSSKALHAVPVAEYRPD